MINKKYLQLMRSYHKNDMNNFIYNKIAERIIDSLDLLSIKVRKALEIGLNDNLTYNFLKNKFLKSEVDGCDLIECNRSINRDSVSFEIDIDKIVIKENYYDLIYSNSFLHISNNFQKTLENIFKNMCSNGFFISIIPCTDNMFQLSNSMFETDLFYYNGAFQRFNPTIEIDNILPIMKNLNFDTPSIHTDNIIIEYQNFERLLKDVKNMNISYSLVDKKQNFENKNYFKKLEEVYKKKYFNGYYVLDIKINIICAWKK